MGTCGKRLILVAAFLLSGLVTVGRSEAVHGQTVPTVTPVTVPTLGPNPTAARVLAGMMQAWEAAGSEHFVDVATTRQTAAGINVVAKDEDRGDVDWHVPPIFDMTTTDAKSGSVGTKHIAQNYSEVQKYSGNLLAVKIGSKKWSCNKFYGYGDLPYEPTSPGMSPDGLVGKNLGLSNLDGVYVWHLRSIITKPGPKGSSKPADTKQRDYFVTQDGLLPVKVTYKETSRSNGVLVKYVETLELSRFGQTPSVKLPATCNGK